MFSFFKKKSPSPEAHAPETPAPETPTDAATRKDPAGGWMDRLRKGLQKTGRNLSEVFTGTRIDDALYEDLEAALLMADSGVAATQFLLEDLKNRVKAQHVQEPQAVRALLVEVLSDLLQSLERPLQLGTERADGAHPTVMMVAGVNGAGKTTTIGKLTRHMSDAGFSVLLAAADTFRAAARDQLAVWADRSAVDIISQEGSDPASVSFDAVKAGQARKRDVVLIDTAGRLATQLHLMEELKKIRRVIDKAMPQAPHEVLLVVDGHTGQNALAQVKAFDDALQLTGLVVTKLDGTARGGVLAAIARERPIPVYFIGVGEQLQDLQPFHAREFAEALLA